MPQPYPGQKWKHGWIPLTPGAAREKNHGRKPGGGSLIARMVAEAAETHQRMLARDRERDQKRADARAATRSADDALRVAAKNRSTGTAKTATPPAEPPTGSRGMRDAVRHRTDAEGIAWAHRLPNPKNLPERQQESIRAYTGFDDWLVNHGLRGHPPADKTERARYEQLVEDLDAAVNTSRTPEPVIVHRTTDTVFTRNGLKVDANNPEEMHGLVGRVFNEPGFWSTSVGKGREARSGSVDIMIRVPEGYPALNVMPVSKFGEGERELLLRRDTRYVFHAAYKKNGAWILEAEIVPDKWTPPADWAPDPYGPDDGPGKG